MFFIGASAIMFIIAFVVIHFLVVPLQIPLGFKVLFSLLILLISQKMVICSMFFRSEGFYRLPAWFMIVTGFLQIWLIMLFLLMWKSSVFDDVYPYASLVFSLLAGLVVSRELIIGIFRTLAANKGVVLAADVFGKIKTIFLDVAVAVMILSPLGNFYNYAGQIIFYAGAILAIVSGLHYILKNRNVFSEIKEELDEMKKSEFDVDGDKYPPMFFDVLSYGMDGNVLDVETVKKRFKIGSITVNNIFGKLEEINVAEPAENGIKVNISQKQFDDLLADARGE